MEKKEMYALTFCYEGCDDSSPYAATIAVSTDKEKLRAQMKECVEEDTEKDEEDEWNEDCNFIVLQEYGEDQVKLQHSSRINLYTSYRITSVKLL